jgi:glycosyltransferase involved in cell wall biosynthesis
VQRIGLLGTLAALIVMLRRAVGNRHSSRHDVVFYVPGVGSLLSTTSPSPSGGAETQAWMLAKALAARGLCVATIAYGDRAELPSEIDGVRIVRRPAYRKRGVILGKLVEVVLIWRALWQTPGSAIVTRCAGVQVGLIAVYASLARRRLVYASAAVTDFECAKLIPNRRDQALYKLGVHLADEIVVQTEDQIDLCQASFGRRATLINSIAELPELPESASPRPEAFLWVGRLTSYKRPLEYIELARAVPEARFRMVGVPQATQGEGLAEAVAAASADIPNLELLAPRSHPEVGELMARSVASVNTSDFEGMPNVLLESWARGVPALALTHDPGGVIEKHALGGFAHGSRDRLVSLARQQWDQRNDRKELRDRCREYVAAEHSPEAVAGRWLQVLLGGGTRDGEARPARGQLTCAGRAHPA